MKTFKNYIFTIMLLGILLPASFCHAEDIDIYNSDTNSASNPNILIFLDNTSNWSSANQGWPTDTSPPVPCGSACNKQGYYELKAIRTLISGLAANYNNGDVPINVGLMMWNNSNASRDGAYVRSAVQPMTAANRAALIAKVDSMITNFNDEATAGSAQYSAGLFDAFKYFGGYTNPANATADAAPTSNPTYNAIPVFGTEFWGSNDADGSKPDKAAYSGSNYRPVTAVSCGRNFIVFIGNGFPSSDVSSSSNMYEILQKLTNPSAPTTAIAQFPIQNYTTTTTGGTPTSSCAIVTSSPGNTCQNNATCNTNLNNSLYTNTTSSSSTSTTNATTGVVTTITTSPATTHSCINVAACPNSTPKKINACSSTTTTTTTATPDATPSPPSGNAVNRYADEFTDFLFRTDVNSLVGQQNITTYTIDVYKDQQDLNQSALMRNMAKYGNGQYYAASASDQLSKAFDSILSEIQSVNSVFASSSLPVSANTQGTYLNQVFIGMFRPDSSTKPRWDGNLKQYQFKIFNGSLRLADFSSTPVEAINSGSGFITPCAKSAWSTDTGSYWQFKAAALGLCNSATRFSDSPDGDVVEKGGAAQRLRGATGTSISTFYSTRTLKTCTPGSSGGGCTSLTDFNTANTNITAAALGVTPGSEAGLIDWVRGKDLDNENNTTSTPNSITEEMRPSIHGGVIHSQPAVVDYGNGNVTVFYGADDGVFHAVNGNKTDSGGNEYWGFIAPETYSKLNRLRGNSPNIKYEGNPTGSITPTPTAKDYFFDGSTGVFQKPSIVWIYPTMRRGGRAIYAFDASTSGAAPSLKWRRGCFTNNTTNDADCSSGWAAMGQSWSKPLLTYLSGYVDGSSNPKPVLVFGGGYDMCEDINSQTRCTGARKGANIWFVDADNGNILRTYPTNYSVPGDVTLIKDANGNATYAYAADTGGYVYRVNIGTYIGSTVGTGWTSNSSAADITIADLGGNNHALKFLFGPDVITYLDTSSVSNGVTTNAVLLASGDREHPLSSSYACNNFSASDSMQNKFFMLKDVPTAYPASPVTPTNLTDVTTNLAATQSSIGANGWFFNLSSACEQGVNKAITIGGVTYFGTNGPKTSAELGTSCGLNLGNARGYAVSFLTGAAIGDSRFILYPRGGLPPSPVAGVVDIDGKKELFCISCAKPGDTKRSPLEGTEISIDPKGPRKRVYWYLNAD